MREGNAAEVSSENVSNLLQNSKALIDLLAIVVDRVIESSATKEDKEAILLPVATGHVGYCITIDNAREAIGLPLRYAYMRERSK